MTTHAPRIEPCEPQGLPGKETQERLSMKMSSRREDRGGPVRAEFAAVAEQGPEHVDEAPGER